MPAATSNRVMVSLQGLNPIEGLQSSGAVVTGALSAFTVPQVESLQSAGGVVSGAFTEVDPFFADVVLLMPMDGTNGSTSFPDLSLLDNAMTSVTAGGSLPTVTTSNPKFGTGSALFPAGPQQGSITTPITSNGPLDIDFLVPFTIEGWVMVTGNSGAVMSDSTITPAAAKWSIALPDDSGSFGVSSEFRLSNGQTLLTFSSTTFSGGTWNHFALVDDGTFLVMYLNGVGGVPVLIEGSPATTSGVLHIGAGEQGALSGQIDEIRITIGVARYTSNFTPPTEPFPTS